MSARISRNLGGRKMFFEKDSQTAYEDKQRDDSALLRLASCICDSYFCDIDLSRC